MATDAVKFVSELQLPTDHDLARVLQSIGHERTSPQPARSDQASAQVNAGSLTSFTQNLAGQNKDDVKNSTLLAQLAADKKFNRNNQPMDWYQFYTNTLGGIGWNQPAFAFDSYTSGGSTVKLDEAVLGILAAIATQNELLIVRATMNGLSQLADDTKQMRIWNANSNEGNNGNFQVFPCDRLPNGDVVMVLDGMQFKATTHRGRFLWVTWESTSIQIKSADSKFVLNETIYAKIRQQVIDKLGDRASQLVADIEI